MNQSLMQLQKTKLISQLSRIVKLKFAIVDYTNVYLYDVESMDSDFWSLNKEVERAFWSWYEFIFYVFPSFTSHTNWRANNGLTMLET